MIYFFVFLLSLLFVFFAKKIALRLDIVDRPNSSVKTHTEITPYLGGAGFFFAWLVSVFFFGNPFDQKIILEICALLVIFLLGLADDILSLKISTRWIFQFFAALILLYAGDIARLSGNITVDILFTIFGILFMINAMNILDILDGLSSGITIVILFGFIYVGTIIGNSFIYTQMICFMIASLCGFLVYNFNPASIFMGDCGSTTLGVFQAILFINTFNASPEISTKMASLLCLSVPIFEVIFVSILRLRKGLNPMHGSKDHFALRFHFMGHSIKEAVLLSWGLALIAVSSAAMVCHVPYQQVWAAFVCAVLGWFVFGYSISKVVVK